MGRRAFVSEIKCKHCGGFETSKAGFLKGSQRYRCRSCQRCFVNGKTRPVGRSAYQNRITRQARRAAGEKFGGPAPKPLPSEGQLILTLRALAQRFGRTPTSEQVAAHSRNGRSYPIEDYYRVFGSYVEAVRRAGLPANYYKTHDKELLLAELRQLRTELKRPIFQRDVTAARQAGKVSPISHFQRTFGSVPNAIKAADAGRKIYTREEMIAILRKLDAKLTRPVAERDIDALFRVHQGPSVRAIEKEFKGLARARRIAGINNNFERVESKSIYWCRYTPDELIAQLKHVGKLIGRTPTDRDLNDFSKKKICASAATFARMFGGLTAAYRKAGFHKPKPHRFTDDEIVAALSELARELGRMPTFHEIRRASMAGKCPSPGTITRRLGFLTDLKERFDRIGKKED